LLGLAPPRRGKRATGDAETPPRIRKRHKRDEKNHMVVKGSYLWEQDFLKCTSKLEY
jgi:hypothetical protein